MGEAGACNVRSLPQIETRSGGFGWEVAARAPSNGMRIACTRSGSISEINLRARLAARLTVAGPSQWRTKVRSPMVPDEVKALGPIPLSLLRTKPLKATGTVWSVSRPLSAGQAKVEIRWTSDPPAMKYRIQFRAIGLLPSATYSNLKAGSLGEIHPRKSP